MGKLATNAFIDGGLLAIDNCTRITVLSAEPASITDITTTYKLATGPLTAGDGNGDYVIADGDTSGRKLTIAQQADLSITASGDATHVAIDDRTDYYVTTCTTQTLTAGGTVTVGSWKIEISDPA